MGIVSFCYYVLRCKVNKLELQQLPQREDLSKVSIYFFSGLEQEIKSNFIIKLISKTWLE